jgi:hypothetical protein
MFENRQKALTIKILVGQDQGDKVQEDLKKEDSAPALLEVDKPELKGPMMPPQDPNDPNAPPDDAQLTDEMMGGAEAETSKQLASGAKPRGLGNAVRMNIMKNKLKVK